MILENFYLLENFGFLTFTGGARLPAFHTCVGANDQLLTEDWYNEHGMVCQCSVALVLFVLYMLQSLCLVKFQLDYNIWEVARVSVRVCLFLTDGSARLVFPHLYFDHVISSIYISSNPSSLWIVCITTLLGIELILGMKIISADVRRKTLLTSGGETISYKTLIVATGARVC